MRIAVTGASGLIGRALTSALAGGGDEVLALTRSRSAIASSSVFWDPARGDVDSASLEGVDAAVHLAGESIAGGRWNQERRGAILSSRVEGTRLISRTLARLTRPPKVLVSASAVGFYGDRGEEKITEESPRGTGFLAEVCEAWEGAADPAREAGIRVVHPRIGVVLSPQGGALARMLPAFRLGLGGRVGDGRQYMSWITLEDAVGALRLLLAREEIAGPVNTVAPNPVTGAEFARTLGRALRRPALLPLPGFLVKALFGEMGKSLLLEGARVIPAKLQNADFRFHHPVLEEALEIVRKND